MLAEVFSFSLVRAVSEHLQAEWLCPFISVSYPISVIGYNRMRDVYFLPFKRVVAYKLEFQY